MLELSLVPKQGNAGGRYYPHAGFLGVTPVTISGTILSKLVAYQNPLPVKSIHLNVRCYETRSGGAFGVDVDNVLWDKTKRIWQSADSEYTEIGDWKHPFSITIPVDAADKGQSTQFLKDWKAVWRLELILEHKPIPYVGQRLTKAYALNLHDHSTPSIPPPSPPSATIIGSEMFAIQLFMNAPHGAFGPGDAFTVSFSAKPDDPQTSLKRASVVLQRRTELLNASRDNSPSSSAPEASSSKLSIFRRSASPRPGYRRISSEDDGRVSLVKLAEATCEEPTPGSGGSYWSAMNMSLPKRGGRWDLGETQRTKFISTSYELVIKVTLKSRGRAGKDIICPPIPIILVGASATERANAQALLVTLPVKSSVPAPPTKRKYRSSRRGLYMHEGTIDISDPVVHANSQTGTRRRHKTKSSITEVHPILVPERSPEVRPILIGNSGSLNPSSQGQSISFAPSPTQNISFAKPAIQVESLLNPDESFSIIKQFQQSGRRISATTSEEEDAQPLKSRLKTLDDDNETKFDFKRGLPSLDTLGLGLPVLPDDGRPRSRPRTAPIHSAFSMRREVPPPLSGGFGESLQSHRPVTSFGALVSQQQGPTPPFAFAVPASPPA